MLQGEEVGGNNEEIPQNNDKKQVFHHLKIL